MNLCFGLQIKKIRISQTVYRLCHLLEVLEERLSVFVNGLLSLYPLVTRRCDWIPESCVRVQAKDRMAEATDSGPMFFSKATPEQWSFVLSQYKEVLKERAATSRKSKKGGPEELIRLDTW